MFDIPSEGFPVCDDEHNCNLELCCDWIEASLLFGRMKKISKTDIVDALIENEIYSNEDFAYEWVENVWSRLLQRENIINEIWPFALESQYLKKINYGMKDQLIVFVYLSQ